MQRMSIFVILLLLIASIVCDDDNNVTKPLSSTTTTTGTSSTTTTTISQSSTLVTSSTTASPTLENATKPTEVPSTTATPKQLSSNRTATQCNCDLTLNCDFNCCCDLDCSDESVEAFDCTATAVDIDIEDFYHGEGLERCDIDGGLFCIANIPSLNADEQSIHVPFHAEYTSYRWPKVVLEPAAQLPSPQQHHNNFYKFDDEILTFDRKVESFQTIEIPAYAIGDNSRCFLTEPVRFLHAQSIKCLRSINELCSFNSQLMLQLLNSQMFPRPPTTMTSVAAAVTDQEASFGVVVESCKHSSDNCSQIAYVNEDGSIARDAEVLEFLGDEVYENIQIEFVVNGSKIVSASARFTCRNNLVCGNNEELDPTKLIQNIDVRFRNFDEAQKGKKRIRDFSSSMRGFNDGDNILASRLRPLNESAPNSSEMMFDFFRNDTPASAHFYNLKLPVISRSGKCVLTTVDVTTHEAVRFNENSLSKCTVELMRDENSNFTVCQQFQHQLIHFLFSTLNLTSNYSLDGYLSDVYISKFWTPSMDVSSWARVSFFKMPLWSPEMQESEKMITCLNIITSANYKFLYATHRKSTSGTRRHQHVIEDLQVEFGQMNELRFNASELENSPIRVQIQINVQFTNSNFKTVKNSSAKNFANHFHLFSVIIITAFYFIK